MRCLCGGFDGFVLRPYSAREVSRFAKIEFGGG